MDNNNFIFVIGKNDYTLVDTELNVLDVFDVRDKSKKRLMLSKLSYGLNKKFFIESNFLPVVNVDLVKNKLILELDNESSNVFRTIDNKVINLLGDLLENNSSFDDVEIEGNLTYIPLVSDEKSSSNTLRLCLDSKMTFKYNTSLINLSEVKVGDMFRFLLGIESINLYPNEEICFVRTYCHAGEIYRTNISKLEKRTSINNYKFTTEVENIFTPVVLEDQDISLIQTEIEDFNNRVDTKNNFQIDAIEENDLETDSESDLEQKSNENINSNIFAKSTNDNIINTVNISETNESNETSESRESPELVESSNKQKVDLSSESSSSSSSLSSSSKPKIKPKKTYTKRQPKVVNKPIITETKGKRGRKKKIN